MEERLGGNRRVGNGGVMRDGEKRLGNDEWGGEMRDVKGRQEHYISPTVKKWQLNIKPLPHTSFFPSFF